MPQADTDDALDTEIATTLRKADQRYTNGRRRLVDVLRKSEGPLTITQIVAADSSLPQSTAYRNLTILEEVGVVARVVTHDDFARYELAEHLTGHHHHLICSSCGSVIDFSLDGGIEERLDNALHDVAERAGFTIEAHTLDLIGTCKACSTQL